MQLCGFLNYCYGYWTTVWSLDYRVFTELLTPLTRKWSHNCTYRKMKTEVIISFSTKISQFSINKHLYELRACSEYDDQSIGRHFFTAAKLRETRQNTIRLSGIRFMSSLFISPSVFILLRFSKKKSTNDVYLALSMPAPSWNTRSPGCKVI